MTDDQRHPPKQLEPKLAKSVSSSRLVFPTPFHPLRIKENQFENKKEFVEKMLPVVDAFRAAPIVCPSASERENSMHTNLGSLCKMILEVFEKYGFTEYNAG